MLRPLWESGSMGSSVIRLKNGGRLDFWTLGNEIAGRSRRYRRVVIDEAAFAKNGDNKVDGSMMEIWEKAIKPTLFDYGVTLGSFGLFFTMFLLFARFLPMIAIAEIKHEAAHGGAPHHEEAGAA